MWWFLACAPPDGPIDTAIVDTDVVDTDDTDVVDTDVVDTDVVDTDDTDIEAPFADLTRGTWSFVPVDDMICANGSATGIGVNPGTDPRALVVLVAGGGACWDGLTCFVLKSAVNIENAWGAGQLAAETRGWDRADLADWPAIGDATWVYVPYCTGDLHAGTTTRAYDAIQPTRLVHHAGDANWAAWIARTRRELPELDRLWTIGFSAGGYGAQLQADKLAAAWPTADGAILADGAPMVTPYGTRHLEVRNAWGLHTPAGCEACTTGFPAYVTDNPARASGWRWGLVTSEQDAVITLYFGYPAGGLGGAVDGLVSAAYRDDADASAFVASGTEHVLLPAGTARSRGGVALSAWSSAFFEGPTPADAP